MNHSEKLIGRLTGMMGSEETISLLMIETYDDGKKYALEVNESSQDLSNIEELSQSELTVMYDPSTLSTEGNGMYVPRISDWSITKSGEIDQSRIPKPKETIVFEAPKFELERLSEIIKHGPPNNILVLVKEGESRVSIHFEHTDPADGRTFSNIVFLTKKDI